MVLEIKHAFQSVKGDGADATLVQPSDWNALHDSSAIPGLVGNPLDVTGPLVEVPLGPGLRFNDTHQLEATAQPFPVGIILPLAGNFEPPGWLYCDGREVSRTTYHILFDICQTKFGSGNGTSTFNIPDLRGRVPAGKDNIGGTAANRLTSATFPTGANDVGKTAGTERHILTENQLATHIHSATMTPHFHYVVNTIDSGDSAPSISNIQSIARSNVPTPGNQNAYKLEGFDADPSLGYTSFEKYDPPIDNDEKVIIGSVGLNEAHLNLQPMITMTYIVFTGVYP